MAVTDIARIEDRIDKVAAGATEISMELGGVKFQSMIEVMEFSKLMSCAGAAIPQHLRGNPGACLAICTRALRFGFDPFTLAEHSYLVNNKGQELVAYDSFVVHAIIEAHAPKMGRLRFEILGDGDERRCRVWTTLAGENKPIEFVSETLKTLREARGRNEYGKIKGSPLWEQKPEQQLIYNARRDFCRIYFPEVLMGVWDRDEFEGADRARDVTPKPSIAERLKKTEGQRGFSQEHVTAEIGETNESAAAPTAQQESKTTKGGADSDRGTAAVGLGGDGQTGDAFAGPEHGQPGEEPGTQSNGWVDLAEGSPAEKSEATPPLSREASVASPDEGDAGGRAESDRTQGAPSNSLFTSFAEAMFRATQPRSLQKLADQFWAKNTWPAEDGAACDRLDAILKIHERRVTGKIDARACQEEIKELVA